MNMIIVILRTTSHFRITDRKHAPKGQAAIQNSLQERIEIEASGGKGRDFNR